MNPPKWMINQLVAISMKHPMLILSKNSDIRGEDLHNKIRIKTEWFRFEWKLCINLRLCAIAIYLQNWSFFQTSKMLCLLITFRLISAFTNVKMWGVCWAHDLITFFGAERSILTFAFNCGNISPLRKNIAKYLDGDGKEKENWNIAKFACFYISRPPISLILTWSKLHYLAFRFLPREFPTPNCRTSLRNGSRFSRCLHYIWALAFPLSIWYCTLTVHKSAANPNRWQSHLS